MRLQFDRQSDQCLLMLGVCFQSIEKIAVAQVVDPRIEEPTDAIIQVDMAGLCGSDLHPFFGRETGLDAGTVMGHEFVGHVVEVGKDVQSIRSGQRVCAPFTTNCGHCYFCKSGLTSRCERGQLFGWRENAIGLHGGQAQFVRVPLADGTLMRVPDAVSDLTALLLGDNLSTGNFCLEMAWIDRKSTYVVIGCGTVGLLAVASAIRRGAQHVFAIDPVASRRRLASQLGATTFANDQEAKELIAQQTDGRGADAVMELVGAPAAQKLAIDLVRPGGTLSVIGCHCTPHFAFSPADAYDKNLTYRTGRCPARRYMSTLAESIQRDPMDLSWAITHTFRLDEAEKAYDVFSRRKDDCIKAVIDFS